MQNGFLPFKVSDSSLQFLDFFCLGVSTVRSNAVALLLELINPATQHRLDYPKRAAGFDMDVALVALIEHEACGLAFEPSDKGKALLGVETLLYGGHTRLNGCPV